MDHNGLPISAMDVSWLTYKVFVSQYEGHSVMEELRLDQML